MADTTAPLFGAGLFSEMYVIAPGGMTKRQEDAAPGSGRAEQQFDRRKLKPGNERVVEQVGYVTPDPGGNDTGGGGGPVEGPIVKKLRLVK